MSMQDSDLQYHLNPKIEIAAKHVTPNAAVKTSRFAFSNFLWITSSIESISYLCQIISHHRFTFLFTSLHQFHVT